VAQVTSTRRRRPAYAVRPLQISNVTQRVHESGAQSLSPHVASNHNSLRNHTIRRPISEVSIALATPYNKTRDSSTSRSGWAGKHEFLRPRQADTHRGAFGRRTRQFLYVSRRHVRAHDAPSFGLQATTNIAAATRSTCAIDGGSRRHRLTMSQCRRALRLVKRLPLPPTFADFRGASESRTLPLNCGFVETHDVCEHCRCEGLQAAPDASLLVGLVPILAEGRLSSPSRL